MIILALVGANVAEHMKNIFTSGILWRAYGLRNGISPLTIQKEDVGPIYPTCFYAIIENASATVWWTIVF